MRRGFTDLAAILLHFGFLLVLFSCSRLAFYFCNQSHFAELGMSELAKLFFYGLRFDSSVIVYLNLPFLICYFWPLAVRSLKQYRLILGCLFVLPNCLGLFVNCGDAAFFRFSTKRSTADIFSLVGTGQDFRVMLPRYLADYWYLVVIWLACTAALLVYFKKLQPGLRRAEGKIVSIFERLAVLSALVGLTVIGARGGLQIRPISPINAAQYASAQYASLVLNTPFTMMQSLVRKSVSSKIYYSPQEMERIYSTYHPPSPGTPSKRNVVLIVLESFSREYVGSLNGRKCCTPFLDTLIDRGLIFENAYANGKSSITGVPSTVAGIPSFTGGPFILSRYINNSFYGIASLLKINGYSTAFFHGGENGTMGFNYFMKLAGYDSYFGRSEYNNDADFDGNWGIWDEEYLQYFARNLLTMPQPFFTTIFTLTSHDPFVIPAKYSSFFPAEETAEQRSVRYTDYALRRFFESAEQMPWFKDTIFILTADHTLGISQAEGQSRVEMYSIPILFYSPAGDLTGRFSKTFQQIDIMPTLLDILHYDKPYFSFGTSAFDKREDRYAYSFSEDVYQIITDGYALHFGDGEKLGLYRYKEDRLLQKNLLGAGLPEEGRLETQLKAFMQSYSEALQNNKMIVTENAPPPKRINAALISLSGGR